MVFSIKSFLKYLEKRITEISDREYRPGVFSLEGVLVAVSYVYQAMTGIRLAMYWAGILKQKKLPCPVISIGNITAGGSGKTPMTIYLAELLIDMGYRPVVVSRGYGGNYKEAAAVVGDGGQVLMDAQAAGDEPFMMAMKKRFPVVVGRKRYTAGRLAVDTFHPDVIILDDGFQHLALARELNLVLFDHDRPLGNGRMLPAGRLRETPAMARERIDGIVLTRCPISGNKGAAEKRIHEVEDYFPDHPIFYTRHQPFLARWSACPPNLDIQPRVEGLKGKKAVLFSGIAQNHAFRNTVAGLRVQILAHLEFQDHYRYNRADFEAVKAHARTLGADMVLTTEKDHTKMDPGFDWEMDLGVIGVRMGFDNEDGFKQFFKSKLNL
ncbi:MAG: tetraacyldisaccharide 4'-kinase [Desulfobacter sp.]|nr:MAG: tetraacyldisaccharide 4'-kinase [Desulfobacter sp.]